MIPDGLFPYFFMKDRKIINDILESGNVVAIVGFSDNHERPSNRIARYLRGNLFKVYGVNPRFDNKIIDEMQCYSSLADIPEKINIVNIFRRSEFVEGVVKEILSLEIKPDAIWAQIGVISNEARDLAEKNDIKYVDNLCIMIEHANF